MSEAIIEPPFEARPDRVDHAVIWNKLNAVHGELTVLTDTVGKPGTIDGGVPATGIFSHLNAHHTRIKAFERRWERGVGFAMAAAPSAALIWWLAGDRISAFFHGG